jgi:hypothetical protein
MGVELEGTGAHDRGEDVLVDEPADEHDDRDQDDDVRLDEERHEDRRQPGDVRA